MADIFVYNGDIERGPDLEFIQLVAKEKRSDDCVLLLVTGGGSPDAAYKIARYLQRKYRSFKVMIPGWCKSAGTLLAIGADELIFAPYGELGPLDVQMAKADRLSGPESGLNISEAFRALEQRAHGTYHKLLQEVIQSSGGVVTFQTASHSATEIISALYGPIFTRIDPEEVGSRSRAMRIGEDYGNRLNSKWSNLKAGALKSLSQSYSSHGFVIDFIEAKALFNHVREANDREMGLIESLGSVARFPQAQLTINRLENIEAANDEGGTNDETRDGAAHRAGAGAEPDGEDIGEAVAG